MLRETTNYPGAIGHALQALHAADMYCFAGSATYIGSWQVGIKGVVRGRAASMAMVRFAHVCLGNQVCFVPRRL